MLRLIQSTLACLSLLTIASIAAAQEPADLAVAKGASEKAGPNILLIYIDDMGWRDVGFMGSDFYETPHLDALAKTSTVFTNAYAAAANCAPSRACLLSGQYTPRHKLYNVGTKPRGKAEHRRLEHIAGTDTLNPKGIQTWAQRFQDAGYRTATMGKWHLSDDPLPYGFDINVGGNHSGSPPRGYYPPHPKAPGLEDAPKNEYLTERLNEEACKFIEANKDRPWLLYLTHYAIHTPLQPKKELVAKYENKPAGELHSSVKLAGMIESVDDGVGQLMETLKQNKLLDNTVIIFTSDNGGYGPATDMKPLKGYKGTYYEGGIRVPMFIKLPGRDVGTQLDEPVSGVDLYPTLCELAGISLPQQPLDGVSLVKLANGEATSLSPDGTPRALFWHFPAYLQSYGRNRKLTDEQRDRLFRSRPCSVIREGRWKLIQYFESNETELYDLKNDIGEEKNVANDNAELAQEMLEKLKSWQRETGADIPRQPNPAFNADAERKAIEAIERKEK